MPLRFIQPVDVGPYERVLSVILFILKVNRVLKVSACMSYGCFICE